jgi:hypothetical protein
MLRRAGLAALAPDLRQILLNPFIHNLAAKYRLANRVVSNRERIHLYLLDNQGTVGIKLQIDSDVGQPKRAVSTFDRPKRDARYITSSVAKRRPQLFRMRTPNARCVGKPFS